MEGMAYERGHSGGAEEVFCIVKSMVADLKDAMQEYGDRRYEEGKTWRG